MRDVIELAKAIQRSLPLDESRIESRIEKAQQHNGKPCSVDLMFLSWRPAFCGGGRA